MKVSYLCANTYYGAEALRYGGWPTPQSLARPEEALRSHRINFELALLADELGFDWVSTSEHHYSPRLLAPNAMLVSAAAARSSFSCAARPTSSCPMASIRRKPGLARRRRPPSSSALLPKDARSAGSAAITASAPSRSGRVRCSVRIRLSIIPETARSPLRLPP